jgi:CheY-like chemotaxis protein
MRVLVIDDGLVRHTLSTILQAAGHDCTLAADALSGIERAEDGSFELALIDINMPGLNGLEAIKAIAHMRPPVAIIAMSGRKEKDGEDYARLSRAIGAHAFLSKPFRRGTLLAAIDDAVGRRG